MARRGWWGRRYGQMAVLLLLALLTGCLAPPAQPLTPTVAIVADGLSAAVTTHSAVLTPNAPTPTPFPTLNAAVLTPSAVMPIAAADLPVALSGLGQIINLALNDSGGELTLLAQNSRQQLQLFWLDLDKGKVLGQQALPGFKTVTALLADPALPETVWLSGCQAECGIWRVGADQAPLEMFSSPLAFDRLQHLRMANGSPNGLMALLTAPNTEVLLFAQNLQLSDLTTLAKPLQFVPPANWGTLLALDMLRVDEQLRLHALNSINQVWRMDFSLVETVTNAVVSTNPTSTPQLLAQPTVNVLPTGSPPPTLAPPLWAQAQPQALPAFSDFNQRFSLRFSETADPCQKLPNLREEGVGFSTAGQTLSIYRVNGDRTFSGEFSPENGKFRVLTNDPSGVGEVYSGSLRLNGQVLGTYQHQANDCPGTYALSAQLLALPAPAPGFLALQMENSLFTIGWFDPQQGAWRPLLRFDDPIVSGSHALNLPFATSFWQAKGIFRLAWAQGENLYLWEVQLD